ncbi:DUF2059 domain-containing protein [Sphaerotilus natans]|jgi:hypothetical protein|uniref:DUF2059 domain-containing protein n=1 Tax=Sphaerotilus natans subsp. natans DSM 6575 TaxID=1286631 RepID=A0A059KPU5_9BURK|nr:DUF2059 domain-containing protein [Sphaerotilus natans]KDB53239.1 hypothetical protein X805_10750 [Sphaerotilus natans subsp. natans DSM 6575]SIQ04173.1 hypothetical protein SAMN05421778_101215 [Sphaerotilus natans]
MTCLSTLRRLALIPAATLVLLAALPAQAAEPSPAKKELIAKVVSLQQGGIDGIARGLVEQPAMALMQQAGMILQTRVAPEKREALAKEIQADVRKYVEEATPIVRERAQKAAPGVMGALLDERFTEDELKQLVAWLESPVVRRYQQMTPDIQKGLSEKLVADTRAAVEPKLQALDRSISARLGVQPPASAPAKK